MTTSYLRPIFFSAFIFYFLQSAIAANEITGAKSEQHFSVSNRSQPSDANSAVRKRNIEEKPAKVIYTNLEPIKGGIDPAPAIWLDSETILANALQDQPDAEGYRRQRIVLINAVTGQHRTILKNAYVLCGNEERGIVGIFPGGPQPPVQGTFFKISKDEELTELTPQPKLHQYNCLPEKSSVIKLAVYLRESDGLIEQQMGYGANRAIYIDKAIWRRPGQDPVELPFHASEISTAIFLPHLQKYLLNSMDSQGNSDTDRRLGNVGWWKDRQYDLTPFRLLGHDGNVSEIPYPKVLFEYGVRYFYRALPTKAGLLIAASGSINSEYGIFLLNSEQLIRVFGGPRALGMNGRESSAASALLARRLQSRIPPPLRIPEATAPDHVA